jgi:hypothetical protein
MIASVRTVLNQESMQALLQTTQEHANRVNAAVQLGEATTQEHTNRVHAAVQARNLRAARNRVCDTAAAAFPPDASMLQSIHQSCSDAYNSYTAEEAVRPVHCTVCGMEHHAKDMQRIDASTFACTVGNKLNQKHPQMYAHMLEQYPDTFTYAHSDLNGMVLCKDGIVATSTNAGTGVIVHTCDSCWSSLDKTRRMPALALANNLFRGPVPPELQGLTLAEQILISRYRARVFLVKLLGDSGKSDPATRQTALKGTVVSFEQDTVKAIDTLPASVDSLVDQIAVLYVGTKKPDPKAFKRHIRNRLSTGVV